MIRPTAIIIADSVILDQITNRISLLNIQEQVRSPGYPIVIGRMAIFCMIERDSLDDPQAPQARLKIKLDEQVIFEQNFEVNFQDGLLNRNVLQFQGFVVPRPGKLFASVEVAGQVLDSYRLAVMPNPTPPPQQTH